MNCSTRALASFNEEDTVPGKQPPNRALLWIDAVGGYLVCLDERIVIGQPSPNETVAVPILADLSRRHAVVHRDGGTYVLEPLHTTRVDGREIRGPYILADNQLIQLGDGVRLRFRKPHALSATARLTLESHHKTQPSSDAILLMADSCVLGPHRHCHVPCRYWPRDIIIYRQDSQLFCRADEPLRIGGGTPTPRAEVRPGDRVEGEAISFTWEAL
ncbi:MAG: FHA domain-containing protein [Pirellulales bacterium]|nr:FHA domain-containing protein [Pirellulales bacterium]